MITIAEYIEWRQPDVAEKLQRWLALALRFWQWKAVMEEPPLPGRAGVLSGERKRAPFGGCS